MYPDYTSNENQCHGWHGHHTVVNISKVVSSLWNQLETEQRAAAQELTNSTHNHEDEGVTQTITYTIEE